MAAVAPPMPPAASCVGTQVSTAFVTRAAEQPAPKRKSAAQRRAEDPERYAGHAYVVRVWEGQEDDILISQTSSVWATSRKKTPLLTKAFVDWKSGVRKTPPLLIFTAFRKNGLQPLYGAALLMSPPIPKTEQDERWGKPFRYGELFRVNWVLKCDDLNNLPHGRYDLKERADMSLLPASKAQELIREIKQHINPQDVYYENSGQAIYDRIIDIAEEEKQRGRPKTFREVLEGSGKRSRVDVEYEEQQQPTEDPSAIVDEYSQSPPPPPPDADSRSTPDAPMVDVTKFLPDPVPKGYDDPAVSDLNMCIYDADYTELPRVQVEDDEFGELDKSYCKVVPTLRLYGCTKEGHTGVAFVRGFMPYYYVKAPADFVSRLEYDRDKHSARSLDQPGSPETQRIASCERTRNLCSIFGVNLSKAVYYAIHDRDREKYGYGKKPRNLPETIAPNALGSMPAPDYGRASPPVYSVELVRRQNIRGYAPIKIWFLKIAMVTPKFVSPSRTILQDGFRWAFLGDEGSKCKVTNLDVFEANIPYALRFMIDKGLYGCSWVTIKKDAYMHWSGGEESKLTYAPIEVLCWPQSIQAHPPDDPEWSSIAPLRRWTFDIECEGRNGRFPVPDTDDGDPVICIAARLSKEVGDDSRKTVGDVLFTWGRCADVATSNLLCYYKKRKVGYGYAEITALQEELISEVGTKPKLKRCGFTRLENGDVAYWTPDDEATMLRQFREFMVLVAQPHILSGFNVNNFDIPYIQKRGTALGLGEDFDVLGMIKGERTRLKSRVFSSKAYGNRENAEINMPGRLVADVMAIIQKDFKQRSYSLNACAAIHLKDPKTGKATEMKADVPHELIGPLWRDNDDSRGKVASYCWKDVDITDKLFRKLDMLIEKSEMAMATGVPLSYILNRGQQIKVLSLVLRFALEEGLLVLSPREKVKVEEAEKYKGAVVIDPLSGFYIKPTFTLDFSSLYPSIMLSANMSFDTLIIGDYAELGLTNKDMFTLKTDRETNRFVKQSVKEGVLSRVLRALLRKRNEAKAEMKKYENKPDFKHLYRQYNSRQLAMKLSGNSVYGVTGVKIGQLSCLEIGSSVTYWGRQSIELTALMVTRPYSKPPRLAAELEEQYHTRVGTLKEDLERRPNESDAEFFVRREKLTQEYVLKRQPEDAKQYEWRCAAALASYPLARRQDETIEEHQKRIADTLEFIYGDTDSIMVNHKTSTGAQDTIDLGKAFAKWISRFFFLYPMVILFEKIYWPYLLITKKRYAGLKYEKATDTPKKDTKGAENVRRDNCLLASKLVDNMFDTVLKEQSLVKVVELVRDTIQKVLLEEVDLSSLIISKSLQKEAQDYDPVPPHAALAMKMAKRDPLGAPRMGDRVPYIMVARGKKKNIKTGEKAEDPIWAIEHGSPIDIDYYLFQQLYNPIERILDPLIPGITKALFSMQPITVYVPPNASAIARRITDVRKSTGSAEVVCGMADIEDAPAPTTTTTTASVPTSMPPPPPPQPAKPKAPKRKKGDLTAKLIPGQTSLTGLLLKSPADTAGVVNKLIPKPKAFEPLAGQKAIKLSRVEDADGKVSSVAICAGELLKPVVYRVTEPREGYVPVKIHYKLSAPRATLTEGTIGKYGYLLPTCFVCKSTMHAESFEEGEEEADSVAPVCSFCRKKWTDAGESVKENLGKLSAKYRAEYEKSKTKCDEAWDTCLKCRGVSTIDDLPKCGAQECPNFFSRISAKVSVMRAMAATGRFERMPIVGLVN